MDEQEYTYCRDANIINYHISPATPSNEAATATSEETLPAGEEAAMAAASSRTLSRTPTPRSEDAVVGDGDDEVSNVKTNDAEEDSEAGFSGNDEVSDDEASSDETGNYEIKEEKTSEELRMLVNKCQGHNHAHPQGACAKQRIVRTPDGRQLSSAVLKVHFNDTLIDYSRTLASMLSMTGNVDNSAGLDDHDFEHLNRLIEIRFVDLAAGIDPAKKKMSTKNRISLHRYTVKYELFTGESPREMGGKSFLNYGAMLIADEEANRIIAKLEEVILDAIEVVDGLASEREIARRGPEYCPCSVILSSEVRRAFEKEQQYK
jgi:hypothetical protein